MKFLNILQCLNREQVKVSLSLASMTCRGIIIDIDDAVGILQIQQDNQQVLYVDIYQIQVVSRESV